MKIKTLISSSKATHLPFPIWILATTVALPSMLMKQFISLSIKLFKIMLPQTCIIK